jgi:hypothetical protein
MWRLIKALVFLVLLGFLALTGYAYLGEYAPEPRDVTRPVTLDTN